MNTAEIVMHVLRRDCSLMVGEFLRVTIREACKPPHRHAHGEILALYKRRADVLRVWISAAQDCNACGFQTLPVPLPEAFFTGFA